MSATKANGQRTFCSCDRQCSRRAEYPMRPAGASVTMGDTVAPMRDLDAAIDGWRALLGDANVITDPDALRAAESATYATSQRVTAIVRPQTTAEVSAVLRIATEREAPVYPISRGRNWGLGSRVPTGDGCALLDLSEMRAITAFDESLAWMTVEPGVTFRQAHEFLAEHRSKLFVSVTGSSPEASLVGNAVERGDGAGPLGAGGSHVCAIEAVLATGGCSFERASRASAMFPSRRCTVGAWGLRSMGFSRSRTSPWSRG